MRLKYDKEADALYIELRDGAFECETEHLGPLVSVDMSGGQPVGIEILDASRVLGMNGSLSLTLEDLPANITSLLHGAPA